MESSKLNIREVDIKRLRCWDKNPRDIHKDDFDRLKKQIKRLGVYKPLVAVSQNGRYVVLGGNMRLKALQDLGFKKVEISVVKAPTEKKRIEYALSDNDRAGFYVGEQLEELLRPYQDDLDLSEFKVDLDVKAFDLNAVLDQFNKKEPEEKFNLQESLDKIKKPKSKRGQIYKLGRHRLMCGDATSKEDVEKLMDGKKADMVFTDPPYGIDIVGEKGNIGGDTKQAPVTKFRKIIGDSNQYDPVFLLDLSPRVFIWGGNYYSHLLPKGGRWFVWDKNRPEGLTLSDCELAWSNIKGVIVKKYKCTWDGYHREGESGKRIHPAQKPIKLLISILLDLSKGNWLIADLFGGSGSTLIACEQTDRICYMMEIEPIYCDVIRERYKNYVKEKA